MEQSQVEQIKAIPFEVLTDKALPTQDHLYKLIIIGDTGVGKSCLMKRVMDNEFQEQHQVTIGVEFGSYGLLIDGKIIKLQIWDTAGQESFKSVTRIFYRGAHCVFLAYDITRDETFENLRSWLKEIKQHATEDVRIYLIGNKSELESAREVQFDRAVEFARQNGIHKCFETSAKTGQNVEEVFSCSGKELYQQVVREQAIAAEAAKVPTPKMGLSGARKSTSGKAAAPNGRPGGVKGAVRLEPAGGREKKNSDCKC